MKSTGKRGKAMNVTGARFLLAVFMAIAAIRPSVACEAMIFDRCVEPTKPAPPAALGQAPGGPHAASRSAQNYVPVAGLRADTGFYISDFTSSKAGFTDADFDSLVERGEVKIV